MSRLLQVVAPVSCLAVSACSSLGGIELSDSDQGRFTAGSAEDGTSGEHVETGSTASAGDDDHGTSGGSHGGPIEPVGTEDSGTDDESSSGATSDASTTGASETGDTGSGGGTTGTDPQSNGLNDGSGTSSGCDGCLPPCDVQLPDVCDQPCADRPDGYACAAPEGGTATCEQGVWTCTGG